MVCWDCAGNDAREICAGEEIERVWRVAGVRSVSVARGGATSDVIGPESGLAGRSRSERPIRLEIENLDSDLACDLVTGACGSGANSLGATLCRGAILLVRPLSTMIG